MQKEIESRELPRWLLVAVIFSIGVAVALLCTYFYQFWGDLSVRQEIWGQFGDFVGGILNPLFSIVGLCALLYTIRLQSREMANSTRELERSADALKRQGEHSEHQKFDSRLFHLVSLHSQVVANLVVFERKPSLTPPLQEVNFEKELKGGRAINYFLDQLVGYYFKPAARSDYNNMAFGLKSKYLTWRREYWLSVYKYFSSIRNLIKFVSMHSAGSEESFPFELIKSQLDMNEARLLLWMCCFEDDAKDILAFLVSNKLGVELYEGQWFSRELENFISIYLFGAPTSAEGESDLRPR